MTPEQLAEIEERWAKATHGNWAWIIRGNSVQSHAVVCHDDAKSLMPQNICSGISPKTENAQAIASAPTDIQALLAEVRRLNRMVDKAIDKLADFGCVVDTDPCPANYIEVGCRGCVIKYLESEVGNNG